MSWLEALSRTYDNCASAIGDYDNYKRPLVPVYHTVIRAEITITLDVHGEFVSACTEDKKDKNSYTIIPVTESSAGRSSNVASHPLCDNIQYVAGDYWKYLGTEKAKAHFDDYKNNLGKWYNSQYCTDKIKAIYSYISKENMISDIIGCGVFTADKDENYKIDKKAKMNVRFKVICPDKTEHIPETWKDEELFENYIKLYDEMIAEGNLPRSICYNSGEEKVIVENHPKNVLSTAGNAKLISANSAWIDLVWGGRFKDSSEAAEVSYESSQKAHNALSWLIANQGYIKDSSAIVSWCVENKKIPNTAEIVMGNPFDSKSDENDKADTEYEYSQMLNRALSGYQSNIEPNDRIVVMSAAAVTNGRLSIKYYGELTASNYFNNLKDWYSKCSWLFPYKRISSPSPHQIAQAAYGIMQGGFVKANDTVEKSCVERILPCITEGKAIPYDIVISSVKNVSKGASFSRSEHNKIIATTCAIIKAYYKDKGDDITMELNSSNDRSYLYGRLLAVAEALERSTYDPGEDRVTNAERYWSSFAQRPAATWAIIQDRIRPYINKSKYSSRYEKLFEEIHSKFVSSEDFIANKELSPMYVLGYWCQKNELYKSKNNAKISNEEE